MTIQVSNKWVIAFCSIIFPLNLFAGTPSEVELSKPELQDKIKGGWAGQTIGVAYTKPSEAVFNGTMIPPYVQYEWGEHIVSRFMHNDDIYMDFTFMEVIEREGIDAPAESHAKAMADATTNAAYILVGLLYGEKDFFQTMEISMRCGLDSDCNPSNAAGILGT
jgi:hypothetical protein